MKLWVKYLKVPKIPKIPKIPLIPLILFKMTCLEMKLQVKYLKVPKIPEITKIPNQDLLDVFFLIPKISNIPKILSPFDFP